MFEFHQKIWHLYDQKKMLVVIKYWNFFSGLIERKICSKTSPCKANEGKCFLDSHCKDGLSCIKNKCNSLLIDAAFEHSGNISGEFLLVVLVVKDSIRVKLYILQNFFFSIFVQNSLCCDMQHFLYSFYSFWKKSKVFVFYLNLISSHNLNLWQRVLTAIFSKWKDRNW